MREFVLKEEEFNLKFMEKVPEPKEGECFLLYQEGAGVKKSMVVSHGAKYSSTAVRHKHYNKKVTFILQKRDFRQNYRIIMENVDFYFNADVSISYVIQDVQGYFFGETMEEDALRNIAKKCVDRQNKRWQIKQGWELQRELEDDIERGIKVFEGVKFRVEVDVSPDEAAQKILDSDQKTVVEIHTSDNRKNVQIATNEHLVAIAESERNLKLQQIQEIGMLMKNFGALGPVANEYLEGKIDGQEFYNYIMKARTDDMNMLNMAVSNDLLTTEEFMDRINDILTNRRFENMEGQQLPVKDSGRLETHSDKRKDIEDEVEEEKEADTLPTGGFL